MWKVECFEKGIDPFTAKNILMSDVKDILDLRNAIEEKKQRDRNTQDALNKMKR